MQICEVYRVCSLEVLLLMHLGHCQLKCMKIAHDKMGG